MPVNFVPFNCVPAGEDDIRDVAGAFIAFLRSENPIPPASQQPAGVLSIQKGRPDAVKRACRGLLDAVIEDQPAGAGFQRRSAQTHFE